MVLTARISDPSAGDGDDKTEEETFGIDNILLLLAVVMTTSGVEIVVAGDDDDVGRTKDLIFSLTKKQCI